MIAVPGAEVYEFVSAARQHAEYPLECADEVLLTAFPCAERDRGSAESIFAHGCLRNEPARFHCREGAVGRRLANCCHLAQRAQRLPRRPGLRERAEQYEGAIDGLNEGGPGVAWRWVGEIRALRHLAACIWDAKLELRTLTLPQIAFAGLRLGENASLTTQCWRWRAPSST